MATQTSFLGFTPWTVDAISFTAIYAYYARRTDAEAVIENTSDVNVLLRTLDTDTVHERTLLSGESVSVKTGGFRATGDSDNIPLCYAKASSGTATIMVIER